MDVYPDIAVELGVIRRGGLVHKLSFALAHWARRRADGVLVLGECMKNRLLDGGLKPHRLIVAENWANGAKIRPTALTPGPYLMVLYSGNLGLAHDVDTLKQALLELNGTSIAHFVIAGGGGARRNFEQWSCDKGIGDISFRSYSTLEELSQNLANSDIGLVTQKKETLGTLVPSKIYGILASARPVLYIGPKDSTVHRVIEAFGCGWQIDCGDSKRLVELLRTLHQNRPVIEEKGRCARRAFLEQCDLKQGVGRIADAVTSVAQVDCSPYVPVSSERYSV
jgi:glycosyltransferase involved in cell wall biosynthesis